jgi:hypothetical protein
MKRALVFIVSIFAIGHVYANEEKVSIDEKLIKEVKFQMEQPFFVINDLIDEPDVLIYSIDGKLLHSFTKDSIDPVAMRNVDFVMESKSQKIFIKTQELKPAL